MRRDGNLREVAEKVGKRARQTMARTPGPKGGIIFETDVAEVRQLQAEIAELRTRVERLEKELAALNRGFASHESVSRPR